MPEPDADKSTAERVLDLAFYAPLGLAFSVAEALPGLARKGRSRLGPQMVLARTVGQLAVQQGYRQLVGIVTTPGTNPFSPFSSPRPAAATQKAAAPTATASLDLGGLDALDALDSLEELDAPDEFAEPDAPVAVVVPLPPSRFNSGRHRSARAPQKHVASELAIHSYDSLSAPQVVQRLAGLSRDEVAAVRAYEAATRARRTILARAEQLLG